MMDRADGRRDPTLEQMKEDLHRLSLEAQENCNRAAAAERVAAASTQAAPRVPPWIWTLLLSLSIQIAGALYVTGQFNGKFEEFRMAVYQRIDRLERLNDSERHRGPENYQSPPVTPGR